MQLVKRTYIYMTDLKHKIMKKFLIISAIVVALSSAALAGRQASLRESLVDQVDTSAYPTYDKEFAHLKLNACFDKFVGLAGNQIDANTNIDGISNALHDCLTQGGMRYSQNTFDSLKVMIQNIASTKADVLKAISEVSQSLVSLQKEVGEVETETEDGFDAADLGIMATALNAGDSVLKRGGQRAEEAEDTKKSALILKQILKGADNGELNADAQAVKLAVEAVQAAALALEQAKSDLHNSWCGGSGFSPADACCNGGMTLSATDPGRTNWAKCVGATGIRSIIFNNYAEVESCDGELATAGGCADIEAATQAQTNGGECYTVFDCAGNGAHAADRSAAKVNECQGAALVYYDNNVTLRTGTLTTNSPPRVTVPHTLHRCQSGDPVIRPLAMPTLCSLLLMLLMRSLPSSVLVRSLRLTQTTLQRSLLDQMPVKRFQARTRTTMRPPRIRNFAGPRSPHRVALSLTRPLMISRDTRVR